MVAFGGVVVAFGGVARALGGALETNAVADLVANGRSFHEPVDVSVGYTHGLADVRSFHEPVDVSVDLTHGLADVRDPVAKSVSLPLGHVLQPAAARLLRGRRHRQRPRGKQRVRGPPGFGRDVPRHQE